MMALLEKIFSPADIKELTLEELSRLSAEIRELLVQVVSQNGGHLSSNLGAVDLTLALHRVFDAPLDKIIWDIGHQSYTHKIITGRREKIFSIRKKDGLLGFPDRAESEYDVLNTGHASTSLGFASGLAIARDRRGEKFHIVSVIGDGALTGGVALEALNHIGQVKQRLIIILNDNKMSISPNVGGISRHLNYLVSGRPYIRLKEVIQNILKSIPGLGPSMYELAKKLEVLMRTIMVPGSLFDELGIKYIGPVNGHDFGEMLKEFQAAKKHDFPVLLHVVTRKGQGYVPACEDPSSFHSSAPFNIENGKFIGGCKSPSYSEIFGQTVRRLVEQDRRLVALTAAMPEGTGLDAVQKEFPENFFDVGIAEQYMFDFAGGLALGGFKPVLGVYSTFMQRAVDQIIHDISLMRIPILVGLDRAGLVGGDGPTHQGLYDIALLNPIPGIVLMAPKDENELQHMVYSGSRLAKPVFIRYPKEPGRGVPLDKDLLEIPEGKAEVLRRGGHALILAVGPLVYRAMEAAEQLALLDKIETTVVNVRFIKPPDRELIFSLAAGINKIVTIEDGTAMGGFASIIHKEFLQLGPNGHEFLSLAVGEGAMPLASREELLEHFGLNSAGIYRQVRAFVKGG
ncbi:MAG: 1-deoxy-D-xylulose-5-phosphate synthase [Acidobacteria bacterium]|nr:1-deoxy-D-xylulose-5-phosphate synthase [Acidobacteriota bacterium]MBU4306452.1 1-deoxy-D-xylulose-5-phosphate synthase [Acidobacteriota bacterium]MBU4404171.1 1-deoxy-D-xylulose-5-phosphate synthase [Acidobacteriota bacterium]